MVKSMMTYLIEHIDVNIGFYKTMFIIGKVSMLQEKLHMLIQNHLSAYKSKDNKIVERHVFYFMSYVSGAGIALLKHWVQDEKRIKKEDFIHHFYKIVTEGTIGIVKKSV
ncbi:TetR family transcriptional regulator C-terminal domain-containing protein [Staphylococcus pseudoxylosus]